MMGIILFIISEVFAFFSVFWCLFHNALIPDVMIGGTWPPMGITPLNTFSIPLLNTLILLSSGAAITWAHHSLIAINRKGAINGSILTVLLAVVFTGLQVMEYNEAPFTMADSIFGSVFFASTGLTVF